MPQLRLQDPKNRQNSIDDTEGYLQEAFQFRMGVVFSDAYRLYNDLLKAGVAKECAREVLPMAAPTRMYMNGSIRSWLHYCDLRTGHGTQREHAQIAGQIQDILYKELPNVCKAMWPDYD
jgi:thymidylate synthase (FAD)